MSRLPVLLILAIALLARATAAADSVGIDVTFKPEQCEHKASDGDFVAVHYVGKLTDGTVFDTSYSRGEPIEFQLGAQQVIPGWELGIQGMCIGEKRRLEIPPHLGYGDEGAGPIPGGATLVFDVELTGISAEPQQAADGYTGGYETYQTFGEGFPEGDETLGELNFADMQAMYGDEDDGPAEWSAT